MSRNTMLHVGVDVSSKTLDMALMDDSKWLQTKFSKEGKGHAAMIRFLKKRHAKHRFVWKRQASTIWSYAWHCMVLQILR